MTHPWIFIARVILVVLIIALTPGRAFADNGVIPIFPGDESDHLLTKMILVDSSKRDLTSPTDRAELVRDFANLSKTLPPRVMFNSPSDWQLVKLTNPGAEPIRRLIDTNEPFRGPLDLWLFQNGTETLLLSTRLPPRTLEYRTVPERILRSPVFELAPGESAFLLLQHLDEWSAKESFSLISRETLEDRRANRSLWLGILIGTMTLLVVFFLVFCLVLRFWAALSYSLMFALLLVSNLHYDGILFVTFYPNRPELLSSLSGWIALILQFSMVLFLYSVLPLRRKHWLIHSVTAVILAFCFIAVVFEASSVDNISEAKLFPLALGLVLVLYLMLSIFSIQQRVPGATLIVFGIALIIARVVVSALADLALVDLSVYTANAIIPVIQVIDGFVFAALLVGNALRLRRDRDHAREAEFAALQKQLDHSAAQLAAEHERDNARQTAEQNRQRLRVASHDLRQPLTALRASLAEVQRKDQNAGSTLAASVDYLDSVLDSSLRETAPDPSEIEKTGVGNEPLPVQTLFDNIERMFRSEAIARGVDLRCVPTSAVVFTKPIELIRMLSNLVSNAIKYSAGGRIIVGVRRRGDSHTLEVWDNGPGMDSQELARVLKPYERGIDQSIDGEGLGLDIVRQLAQEAQLSFTASSCPERGSVFRLAGLIRYRDAGELTGAQL